ncbi:MAG: hypothetical protein ACR2PA_22810 [Hyphomicrobiaceae bacterium]
MLKWLGRYLAWLSAALAVVGLFLAGSAWQHARHIDVVMRDGSTAQALIEGAEAVTRKNVLSHTVNLAWKTGNGEVTQAQSVPISSSYARRIIADGTLVIPSTEIRYLKDPKTKLPVVAPDAAAQKQEANLLMVYGGGATIMGIIGIAVFGFGRRLGLLR